MRLLPGCTAGLRQLASELSVTHSATVVELGDVLSLHHAWFQLGRRAEHDSLAGLRHGDGSNEGDRAMPVFVSLGRYSENAIKAMLAKPEDRTAAVR